MQWRLLLWDQILLCTFTAKVNHLYVREKSTHWKKTDPCSDEKKPEFWKHKQIKLLICPGRGRENRSSKQIKINIVTDKFCYLTKGADSFQKNTKLHNIWPWENAVYPLIILYIHSTCFLGAGQAAYSEVLCMFKMVNKNKGQRHWVLAGGSCMPWLTSVLLHYVNSLECHWEDSKPNTISHSPEQCRNPVAFPSMSCCDYVRQTWSHL